VEFIDHSRGQLNDLIAGRLPRARAGPYFLLVDETRQTGGVRRLRKRCWRLYRTERAPSSDTRELGIFLDGDVERAAATLARFLIGETAPPEPVAEACDRYLASRQVATFVEVFDQLVGRSGSE